MHSAFKLKSYGAAKREMLPAVEHRVSPRDAASMRALGGSEVQILPCNLGILIFDTMISTTPFFDYNDGFFDICGLS
jgi:hypothetical protein